MASRRPPRSAVRRTLETPLVLEAAAGCGVTRRPRRCRADRPPSRGSRPLPLNSSSPHDHHGQAPLPPTAAPARSARRRATDPRVLDGRLDDAHEPIDVGVPGLVAHRHRVAARQRLDVLGQLAARLASPRPRPAPARRGRWAAPARRRFRGARSRTGSSSRRLPAMSRAPAHSRPMTASITRAVGEARLRSPGRSPGRGAACPRRGTRVTAPSRRSSDSRSRAGVARRILAAVADEGSGHASSGGGGVRLYRPRRAGSPRSLRTLERSPYGGRDARPDHPDVTARLTVADRRPVPVLRAPHRSLPAGQPSGWAPTRRWPATTSARTSRARTAGACTTATWCPAFRSIRTAASRRSPSCAPATSITPTRWGPRRGSAWATCSG